MGDVTDSLVKDAIALSVELDKHRARVKELADLRAALVVRLHEHFGLSGHKIGRKLGISPQRVAQILNSKKRR